MKYVKLGKTDMNVSVLSLGCWAFAGDYFWGEQDDKDSKETVDAAIDLGINFLDTAAAYGMGKSEEVLGECLKGKRDKVILATKQAGPNLEPAKLIESVDKSLSNMKTDYIDLFYIHWPNMKVPFGDTMEGIARLKKDGKIRAAGISNFGLQQMDMLEKTGMLDLIEVHQLPYNLFWRAIEFGLQDKCIEKGLGLICYSSLAQGLLSGRYNSAADVPDHLKVTRFYKDPEEKNHKGPGCEEEVFEALAELKALCKDANVLLPNACLAWLFKQKGVTAILSGPRKVTELMENYKSMETEISDEFAAKMTAISEKVKAKIGSNTDMWMHGDRARSF